MDLNSNSHARLPVLRRLNRLTGPVVDDALLRALDISDPLDQQLLVELLIARGQPRGLSGLVARFHELPAPLRDALRKRSADLAPGLRHCVASPSHQSRLNALELLGNGQHASLAFLAAAALNDPDRQLSELAGDALLNFVEVFVETPRPPEPTGAEDLITRERYVAWSDRRSQLLQAVRSALANYEAHQRPTVLDAAILLTDELETLLRPMLDQSGHRIGGPLQERVGRSNRLGRRVAPLMYLALSSSGARGRFAGRISLLRDQGVVIELIREVGRAARPEVARGLTLVRRMSFFEQPGWWERLPDELATQTVQWIAAIGADPADKARWLVELIRDGSPEQQSAAMEQLSRWAAPESTDALKRVMTLPDAELATQAGGELVRRGCTGLEQLMRDRLSHPDERLRELAAEQLTDSSFEKFWQQYPRLPEEVREFAAQKLRRLVRDLPQRLSLKMVDPDPAARLQAVRVVDLCGLADRVVDALLAGAQDPDAKVRSAVVKLLGQLPGSQSEQLVTQALGDPDRRVRANAVEAVEALHSESASDELFAMLDDSDNRIRANAIKAIMAMDVTTARDHLSRMLTDASADHRLSALWVVEQVAWMKPAQRVLHLAQNDPDRRVRRRALRTLSELRRLYRQARRTGSPALPRADAQAARPEATP